MKILQCLAPDASRGCSSEDTPVLSTHVEMTPPPPTHHHTTQLTLCLPLTLSPPPPTPPHEQLCQEPGPARPRGTGRALPRQAESRLVERGLLLQPERDPRAADRGLRHDAGRAECHRAPHLVRPVWVESVVRHGRRGRPGSGQFVARRRGHGERVGGGHDQCRQRSPCGGVQCTRPGGERGRGGVVRRIPSPESGDGFWGKSDGQCAQPEHVRAVVCARLQPRTCEGRRGGEKRCAGGRKMFPMCDHIFSFLLFKGRKKTMESRTTEYSRVPAILNHAYY